MQIKYATIVFGQSSKFVVEIAWFEIANCLIRFALCRSWSVCRNAALRRNSTFLRRIRCALSPKLIALFANTSSLILINCDTLEYGCTMPYCRKLTALFPNYVHCFQNWPEKGVDIWQDIWLVLYYQSFFSLSLFWRVLASMSCRPFYQML